MRPVAALLAAVAALSLTACSAGEKDVTKPAPRATTPATDYSAPEMTAGLPPEPMGAGREVYLRAIRAVDPRLVEDEEKAVDAGRNQCATLLDGGDKADWLAAQRFGNDSRPLTDAQGKQLNAALRATLCPE
ncbi:hypothetical protein P6B95_07520 [Streptomyces atratus]|uniref:hypothetical protein n=1 Tax=Streptomyces atratus TaxID=1893 RepID=UPI0013003FA8|nr:hypothetical protein [Streptomyces atratus]WPW27258.1 hypothetical protein P6B95_07520 [Streptomyces atratus]